MIITPVASFVCQLLNECLSFYHADKDFNREVLQFQSTLRSSLIKRLHFTTQLSSINFPKVEFTPYADHVEVEILHIYLLRPIGICSQSNLI